MKKITTESGAVYLLNDDGQIKRENPSYEKRGDGEWQTLTYASVPKVGERMVIRMESLSRYGQDDLGTEPEDVSPTTTRVTTPVKSIEDDFLIPTREEQYENHVKWCEANDREPYDWDEFFEGGHD